MAWNGELATLPTITLEAGTVLHHGTDCAGDFEIPDGPAWFAADATDAADWAGWNTPPYDRADGERRTHAFVTTQAVRVIDLAAAYSDDDGWIALCLAATGEDEELTRSELAEALVAHGFLGWSGDGEVMLADPGKVLRFVGRTPVPGANPLRPFPSTYAMAAEA
jgi:hypothetical protein